MADLRPALTALMLVTVLVGCSDDTTSNATGGAASSTTNADDLSRPSSEPEKTGEAIPDGSYARNVTVAEAKAVGITDRGVLNQFGKDGKDTYLLKVAGDRYTLFVGDDVPEPGDGGTLTYDAKDDVAMTSASDGCPGCVYTYDWSVSGDELSLRIVGHESTDTPEDVVIVRFITEGVFTRQS